LHESAATISLSASSGILLTYIVNGPTSTKKKHISRDPYLLLLYDVTVHLQADGTLRKHMSCDAHLLLMCDITTPAPAVRHMENTAYSTVVGVYHVYKAVAWQDVDQIGQNINFLSHLPQITPAVERFEIIQQIFVKICYCTEIWNDKKFILMFFNCLSKLIIIFFLQCVL
jgi:hypothetical protein